MSRERAILLFLLLILFARLTLDARQISFTSDEPSHIASGYAYLAEGATWTIPLRGHPLLIDTWLALPVYLGDPSIPLTTLPGWGKDNTQYVHAFVPYLTPHIERAEVASRTPIMLLTVLLAAVVARWARDLSGARGSLLAVLVLSCDPTLMGHGMLATNDVGVTSLGTLALFLTYRWIRRTTLGRFALSSLALSATLLAKASGVIWLAGALAMVGLAALRHPITARRTVRTVAMGSALTLVTLAWLWGAYGLRWGTIPAAGTSLTVPAPMHWATILEQGKGASGRWTYLLGRIQQGGRWSYFPLLALIKNPLPLLVLTAWSAVVQIRSSRRERLGRDTGTWCFPLLYTALAIFSRVNVGYRHMLPVHPYLYLLSARLPFRTRPERWLGMTLTTFLVLTSLRVSPNYIAYANALIGGPQNGWRYMADSNTDWGQGLKALKTYQDKHASSSSLRLSLLSHYIEPDSYGIKATPLPPMQGAQSPVLEPALRPSAGTYAISANSLSGLGCADRDNYAWFRYHRPDEIIADTLFVYHVAPIYGDTWLAQCTVPTAPLSQETVVTGFATPPKRTLSFDCAQSWVYPAAGHQPGWYALHEQALSSSGRLAQRLLLSPPTSDLPMVARHLNELAVTYRQWDYRDLPAFVLFRAPEEQEVPGPPRELAFIARADAAPAQLGEHTMPAPIPLGGPLEFLGIAPYKHHGSLEIETWWRVTERPAGRPFSIMAHLLDREGQVLAVADGLGISPTELQADDIVVQSHVFADDSADGAAWLRTGAYWLDTGTRWTTGAGAEDAIVVPLQQGP